MVYKEISRVCCRVSLRVRSTSSDVQRQQTGDISMVYRFTMVIMLMAKPAMLLDESPTSRPFPGNKYSVASAESAHFKG